jgi:micrococcal nuclease
LWYGIARKSKEETSVLKKLVGYAAILFLGAMLGIFVWNAFTSRESDHDHRILENGQYPVQRIIDGDTLDVSVGGVPERIRLWGVNTPEKRPLECFGNEATAATTALTENQVVSVEVTSAHEKYGRNLAYVYLTKEARSSNGTRVAAGTLLNLWLIENGFAHENSYGRKHPKKKDFEAAYERARHAKAGMWEKPSCAAESQKSRNDKKTKKSAAALR